VVRLRVRANQAGRVPVLRGVRPRGVGTKGKGDEMTLRDADIPRHRRTTPAQQTVASLRHQIAALERRIHNRIMRGWDKDYDMMQVEIDKKELQDLRKQLEGVTV
jgi:hypothetical protein